MLKKPLTFMIAILMILALTVTVFADVNELTEEPLKLTETEVSATVEEWEYSLSTDKKSVSITNYIGQGGTVIIPNVDEFKALGGEYVDVETVHITADAMKAAGKQAVTLSISSAQNGNKLIADGEDWSRVFDGMNHQTYISESCLESIDLSQLDTSKITNISGMFASCTKLTDLKVKGWDTSKVTDMSYLFSMFPNGIMTSLDLSDFDTGNVTTMKYMFSGCSKLTSLELPSKLDTSKVTDMSAMFANCNGLSSLDVSKLNTSKVTDMSQMFNGCSGLTSLDVTNFDTSNVENMNSMFAACVKLTDIDVSKLDTGKVTHMGSMFSQCFALTKLDLSGFNTSNVTDMSMMFQTCESLTTLDVSGFDTSNVTNMWKMFRACSSLTSLDVSTFDISNVDEDLLEAMFAGCNSLTNLTLFDRNKTILDEEDIEINNTANTDVKLMAQNSIINQGVSSFTKGKVTNMTYMAQTSTDLSSNYIPTATANASNKLGMFEGCSNLTSLDLSGLDSTKFTDMSNMFKNCSKLTVLDLSSFEMKQVATMTDMFYCEGETPVPLTIICGDNSTKLVDYFKDSTESEPIDNRWPIKVTEKVDVKSVSLDQSEISLVVGESTTLTATVLPEEATDKNVTWESSDDSIATVDKNGKVTGVLEGNVIITVTTKNGNKQASCTVTVKKKQEEEITPITGKVVVRPYGEDGGKVSLEVKKGMGTPDAAIIMSTNDLIAATANSDDLQRVAKGENLSIWVKVDKQNGASSDAAMKAITEAAAGKTVGYVLNIELFKQFENDKEATQINNTNTDTTIKLSTNIPEDIRANYENFGIIRYHEEVVEEEIVGKAEVLESIYDDNTGNLYFASDKFSDYGVTMTAKPGAVNTGVNTSSSLPLIIGLIALAVVLAVVVIVLRKKNHNEE